MSTVTSGGPNALGITADAAKLPSTITKVNEISASAPLPYNEKVIAVIWGNNREQLCVTTSTAAWGGRFVCLRFFEKRDGVWQPSKRGVNIRSDCVEATAAALLEALREVSI